MTFLKVSERAFLVAVSKLDYCNPFTPQRIECEREALGKRFVKSDAVWSNRPDYEGERVNIDRLTERVEETAQRLRATLTEKVKPRQDELNLYEDLVLYLLYQRYRSDLHEHLLETSKRADASSPRVSWYTKFAKDFEHYLRPPGIAMPTGHDPAHLFAIFFQVRRAFHHIFDYIIGGSQPAAKLRANVWQSIFTHDLQRYRMSLFDKLSDVTTLVTGASGTGKELVARAIALSRYIPFDPKKQNFAENFASSFHALNLSALSPTLIESELFGHKRGAFTGALTDHVGWMGVCSARGTVFLDEIGDLDAAIQIKLLRVLQTRSFQRLGDTQATPFEGKIIAATNRDLATEMRAGRFRDDFYYRLCSDMITTPSLHAQITDSPDDLHILILFIARRIVGGEVAEQLTRQVEAVIQQQLEPDYRWPGNIRELEQCVWNVLIRNEYNPQRLTDPTLDHGLDSLTTAMRRVELTADELLSRYCTLAYASTDSYEQAARRLKLDRRTIKSKIDASLLSQLKGRR